MRVQWLLCVVFLLAGSTTYVQAEGLLEEVIVTAQKQEQNLQDVSISVTAFSGEAIEKLGFQSQDQLATQTPNLQFGNGGPQPWYRIRGIGPLVFGDANESQVALYVDDVYRPAQGTQQAQLFDIERVEVLRGPQGTLYGRNTTAGLIHFISRKPTEEFESYLEAQLGDYDQRILEGALSGPLSDNVNGRISFKYNRDDGWQENKLPAGGNFAATDVFSARAQLEFNLSENLNFLLKVGVVDQNNTTQIYGFRGLLDPDVLFPIQCSVARVKNGECVNFAGFQVSDTDPREGYSRRSDLANNLEVWDATSTLRWQISDNVELVSVTAIESVDRHYEEDGDGSATGWFFSENAFGFAGPGPEATGDTRYTFEGQTISQELRLSGSLDSFNWIAGLYYFKDEKDDVESALFETFGTITDTLAQVDTKSWAIFGQIDKSLSESLTLIAGLRYTKDERNAFVESTDLASFELLSNDDDLTTSKITGKIGLDWHVNNDLLLYGNFSTGFKSGEFNTTLLFGDVASLNPVDEETVDSFELGLKWTLWDGRGRLNVALFSNTTEDVQSTLFFVRDGRAASGFINGGDIDTKGAEVEFFVTPTDRLDIIFGLGWLDGDVSAEATTGSFNGFGTNGNEFLGDFDAFDGNKLAPELTFNGMIRYHFPIGNVGELALQTDFSWTDEIGNVPLTKSESYALYNLRVSWDSPNEKYYAQAFIENVADKEYNGISFALGGFDSAAFIFGLPRTWGFSFGIRIN